MNLYYIYYNYNFYAGVIFNYYNKLNKLIIINYNGVIFIYIIIKY